MLISRLVSCTLLVTLTIFPFPQQQDALPPAMPSLEGQAAWSYLAQHDLASSLQEAMQRSQYSVHQEHPRDSTLTGEVDARAAGVPLAIDQLYHQQGRLMASDGNPRDSFGYSVAIESETAVIGSPGDTIGSNINQGSVYIFMRQGSTWTQQAKLTAIDGTADDQFGISVAIDSETIVVGTPHITQTINAAPGAAYVFVRQGSTWIQQARLIADDGAANDWMGQSVAISGETIVVGAPGDTIGNNREQGSAYVFVRQGNAWTQQAKFFDADGSVNDLFGHSVAIDSETVVVAVPLDDINGNTNQSSARIFVRQGAAWIQQEQLTLSSGGLVAYSVAIDKDTIVVGSPSRAAYVFVRQGSTWTQQAQLSPVDGTTDPGFGFAVAIAGDTIVVIEHQLEATLIYVFTRTGTAWTRRDLFAPLASNSGGRNSAIAIDGSTLVVSADGSETETDESKSSAFIFSPGGNTWPYHGKLTASDGELDDWFGNDVAIDGDTAVIGAVKDDVGSYVNHGSFYVFVRQGSTWTEQTKLSVDTKDDNHWLGMSVAIAGDTIVVGVPEDDIGSNWDQGSAYVFVRQGSTWSQQARLGGAGLGKTVAIDQDTIVMNGHNIAIVFVRQGSTWTQQAQLTFDGAAEGDWFGPTVAIDGETIVIGSPYSTVGSRTKQGAAYVFVRSGSTWTQQAKLTDNAGWREDQFGRTVAIDGDTVVITNYKEHPYGVIGVAFVFVRQGSTWTQQTYITTAVTDDFTLSGNAVAIDGDTILLGSYGDFMGSNLDKGAAFVFTHRFGTSIALSTSAATASMGQSVTFTATLTDTNPNASPSGAIQFQADGTNLGAPVPIQNGSASYTTTTLATGNHTISAIYSGDTSFATSDRAIMQWVQAPTTYRAFMPRCDVSRPTTTQ